MSSQMLDTIRGLIGLSLIHIYEPTRLGMISYAVLVTHGGASGMAQL